MFSFYAFKPSVRPNQQHCVSFDPRLFSCHLIGGGKDSCHDVGYISGIKRFLKSAKTSLRLTWRASLISIHHLPKVSTLSCQIQLGVQCRSLFCIFFTLVYGLLSRSLPLFAWTAASVMTPPLPNRGWKTTRVLLPVKFSFAGEACWWPHAQPLLGPYE